MRVEGNWRSEETYRVHTILNQPNRHRVSIDHLNPVDSQLVSSLEGESGQIPAGKTFSHSFPQLVFGGRGHVNLAKSLLPVNCEVMIYTTAR